MSVRKKYSLLFFMVLVLAAGILICGYAFREKGAESGDEQELSADSILGTLDGEPITWGEFQLYYPEYRSQVVAELNSRYGFEDSEAYWSTPLPDGSTPMEMAVSRTMEALREVKARQLVFREYGICEDISYGAFLEAWEAENERRADAVKKGQVIYGPQRFEERQYFDYLLDQYRIALEQKLSQNKAGTTAAPQNPEEQVRGLVREKLNTADFQLAVGTWLNGANN